MKVRCVKIINPLTGAVEDTSTWVRVGQEYIVLEVMAASGKYIDLRIVTADKAETAGLFAAGIFETVSARIPSNWVIQVDERGMVRIRPRLWLRRGFWEDYFRYEP